jgi:hypothetical protein
LQDEAHGVDSLAAAEQAHTLKAREIFVSYNNLLAQNMTEKWLREGRALGVLARAEDELLKAQTALNLARADADYSAQLNAIDELAAAGVLSEEQAAEKKKAIYAQENQDQLDSLNIQLAAEKEAVDKQAKILADRKASPAFTQKDLDETEANLDKAEAAVEKTEAQIVKQTQQNENQQSKITQQFLRTATSGWQGFFKVLFNGALTTGQTLRAMGSVFADAMGAAVAAAASGASSFAQAMQQMLKSFLAAMAQMATVKALHELAEGFAALASINPAVQATAPRHFLAAAKFAALAAVASVAAAFSPGTGNNAAGNSSPEAPSNLPPTPATEAGGGTQAQTVNAVHLATGGLISQPTLAVVGDSLNQRSGAREGVIPLDDPAAMRTIGQALAASLTDQNFAAPNPPESPFERLIGHNITHWHVKGDLIDHTQLMRQQSRMVKKGRARLTTSLALNLNRRA